MADTQTQVALRQLRDHLANPRTLFVLVLIGGVLTIVAPFDTDYSLSTVELAAFWTGIAIGTYTLGMAVHLLVEGRVRMLPGWARIAVIAVATGLATGIAVEVFTNLIFGWPASLPEAALEFAPKFAIGLCVSLGLQVAGAAEDRTPPAFTAAEPETPPPILDRIPLEKRGPLVALSVEDHYVRVRTNRGEEMILMRLTDAMRETAPVRGLRVHRSHWVATGMVRAARREGDRAILSMTHGGDIPVSRSHMQAIRAAGLLPR